MVPRSATVNRTGSLAALLISALILPGCDAMFFDSWKPATREYDKVLRIDVPKQLETFHDHENSEWLTIHFSRIHSWAMGSQTPYRTRLQIVVLAPDIEASRRPTLLKKASFGLTQCENIRWLSHETRGAEEWITGECSHSVNTMENDSWIAEVLDPARGLRITFRVWKKDLDLAKAQGVVQRAAASFQPLPGLTAQFAEIRDEPRREAERFTERMTRLPVTLANMGFPKPVPGEAQEHDGFFYLLSDGEERDFTMVRAIGAITPQYPPVNESIPGHMKDGGPSLRNDANLFWFVHQEGEWRQHSSHARFYIPDAIARRLAPRHTDPAKAYFYAATSVRLRDADGWDPEVLRKFTDRAKLAEAQFSRGEIIGP